MKEKYLQQQVNDYLDFLKIKYIHLTTFISRKIICPFCHKRFNKNFAVEKNAGVPDHLIFLKNGKILALEYKVNSNKLTKKQIEWYQYLEKNGYIILVLKNFDAVQTTINYYRNKFLEGKECMR